MLSPPSRMWSLTATRLMSGIGLACVQAKAEQAEVRGAAADIDHQHVSRPGSPAAGGRHNCMRGRAVRSQQ